jgi:hypothetical protein
MMSKILDKLYDERLDLDVDTVAHLLLEKFKEILNVKMTEGYEVTNAEVVPLQKEKHIQNRLRPRG